MLGPDAWQPCPMMGQSFSDTRWCGLRSLHGRRSKMQLLSCKTLRPVASARHPNLQSWTAATGTTERDSTSCECYGQALHTAAHPSNVHQCVPSLDNLYGLLVCRRLSHWVAGRWQASQSFKNFRDGQFGDNDWSGPSYDELRRNTCRLLKSMDYGVDLYHVKVDVRDLVHLTETTVDVPMLNPHELIGGLYSHGWEMFSKVMFAGIPQCQTSRRVGCVRWVAVCG